MDIDLEATHLRDDHYAVRPEGQLGTCGWHPMPWCVQYVNAPSAAEAIEAAGKPLILAGRIVWNKDKAIV